MSTSIVARPLDAPWSDPLPDAPPTTRPMDYAGFRRRAAGHLLDALIVQLVLAAVVTLAWAAARRLGDPAIAWQAVAVALAWPTTAASYAYYALGDGRGGTPGKRLLGLRVVASDGAAPGLRRGVSRTLAANANCVLIALPALALALGLLAPGSVRPALMAATLVYVVGYPALVAGGVRLAAPAAVITLAIALLGGIAAFGADPAPLGWAAIVVNLAGYAWMLRDPAGQTWHDRIAGTYVVREAAS